MLSRIIYGLIITAEHGECNIFKSREKAKHEDAAKKVRKRKEEKKMEQLLLLNNYKRGHEAAVLDALFIRMGHMRSYMMLFCSSQQTSYQDVPCFTIGRLSI